MGMPGWRNGHFYSSLAVPAVVFNPATNYFTNAAYEFFDTSVPADFIVWREVENGFNDVEPTFFSLGTPKHYTEDGIDSGLRDFTYCFGWYSTAFYSNPPPGMTLYSPWITVPYIKMRRITPFRGATDYIFLYVQEGVHYTSGLTINAGPLRHTKTVELHDDLYFGIAAVEYPSYQYNGIRTAWNTQALIDAGTDPDGYPATSTVDLYEMYPWYDATMGTKNLEMPYLFKWD